MVMKGHFSKSSEIKFKKALSHLHGLDYTESELFEFTRCVRPDGSAYGTGGKCKKGVAADKSELEAISQLSQLIPKGEKIVDSAGKEHVGKGPQSLSTSKGSIKPSKLAALREKVSSIVEKIRDKRSQGVAIGVDDPLRNKLQELVQELERVK